MKPLKPNRPQRRVRAIYLVRGLLLAWIARELFYFIPASEDLVSNAPEVVQKISAFHRYLPTSPLNAIPKFLNETIPKGGYKSLPKCQPTSQLLLTNETNDGYWILRSYDQDGTLKTTGGDVFFITYVDETDQKPPPQHGKGPSHLTRHGGNPVTAVALIQDHHDGRR